MVTANHGQPEHWIETILASLAGRVERCVNEVERWADGSGHASRAKGLTDPSNDAREKPENPIRNWRWE